VRAAARFAYTRRIAVSEAPGGLWLRIALAWLKALSVTGVNQDSVGKGSARGLPMFSESGSRTKADRAERVQSILASKGLTLSQVSQKSTVLYGAGSPYFLPHNLYFDLRSASFSPSAYQVFAHSRISGYRLYDWLRVLGFNVEDILRLQVQLPSNRTFLLDTTLEDPNSWVTWFRNRHEDLPAPLTIPLAQRLEFSQPRPLSALSDINRRRFLYAKIGYQDAFAFPDLLPGSIVRVNPDAKVEPLPDGPGKTSRQIFLLQHEDAVYCCRLRNVGSSRFGPVGTQLPFADIEMELPREATIRGVADLEIRSLTAPEAPLWTREPEEMWLSDRPGATQKLSHLLLRARTKLNLSLRDASSLSRMVANLLEDEQYFISASSLSDYEARDTAPRHFQKVMTLCLIYAVSLSAFLEAAGIVTEDAGRDPIPEHLTSTPLASKLGSSASEAVESPPGGFLEELLQKCEEIPFFLRRTLPALSGLAGPSLRDFYWIGGEPSFLHPYLANGFLIMVNRRIKRPRCDTGEPLWAQPLYLVLKRNGSYLCGCCKVDNGNLVMHPYSESFHRPERWQHPNDAEVIGQIVTIARKLD